MVAGCKKSGARPSHVHGVHMPLTRAPWSEAADLDVLRAAGDDVEAFGELVRRHQAFVFGAVLRIVRDRTQAEDLAQEAFLRAFRGRAGFRGDAAVRTWLYRIAVNLATNAVTRRREYPTASVSDRQWAGHGPEGEAETAQLYGHLREAIAELPIELRLPLVLRDRSELTYQEIADATGLPLNTVRTRLFRARRALRSRMEPWR